MNKHPNAKQEQKTKRARTLLQQDYAESRLISLAMSRANLLWKNTKLLLEPTGAFAALLAAHGTTRTCQVIQILVQGSLTGTQLSVLSCDTAELL